MLSEKSKNFVKKKVTQIRASQIRASQIRATQIRASQIRASQIRATKNSSNQRELHGAMFFLTLVLVTTNKVLREDADMCVQSMDSTETDLCLACQKLIRRIYFNNFNKFSWVVPQQKILCWERLKICKYAKLGLAGTPSQPQLHGRGVQTVAREPHRPTHTHTHSLRRTEWGMQTWLQTRQHRTHGRNGDWHGLFPPPWISG